MLVLFSYGYQLWGLIKLKQGRNMMFQESMVIPSLYTRDEQVVIERWIMQQASVYPVRDNHSDANKVAEIALSSVQSRLPQGLSIKEDGSRVIGRKTWDCPVRMRNDLFSPIHLFAINWDDSHPGFSWPEVYYATLLLGYNVYVVTVSHDAGDSHGYFDVAIGSFQVEEEEQIAEKGAFVVKEWWQFQHQELRKCGWKSLLKPGIIDAESACLMREEVWHTVENHG